MSTVVEWRRETDGDCLQVLHRVDEVLHRGRTRYQQVELLRNQELGTFLVLDGDFQCAALDEFVYHETLVHPVLVAHPDPRRVLVLGGGEGAALREVLRHRTVEQVWLVDLDGELVDLCRRHAPEFSAGAFEDPRVQVIFEDAQSFLARSAGEFDAVFSDLTDPHPESPSRSLFGEPFFRLVRSRLASGGILALQASRADFHRLDRHLGILSALQAVFPRVAALVAAIPSFLCDWSFLTASDRVSPADLGPEEVEHRLAERGLRGLRHYDGQTHARLLALPRPLRAAVEAAST